jgi:hypothetical protein
MVANQALNHAKYSSTLHYLEYDIIDENSYINLLPKYQSVSDDNMHLNA